MDEASALPPDLRPPVLEAAAARLQHLGLRAAVESTRLLVEGHAPILREKDIMTPERADTPAKRIYLAVQLMYTAKNPQAHHELYFSLVRDIVQAAPSMWPHIENINNQILMGQMYKALKDAKKLINYEKGLLDHAARRPDVR